MTQQTESKEDVNAQKSLRAESLPDILRIGDVCDYLGITRRLLQQLRTGGQFPSPFFVGSYPRWTRQALLDWIASGGSQP